MEAQSWMPKNKIRTISLVTPATRLGAGMKQTVNDTNRVEISGNWYTRRGLNERINRECIHIRLIFGSWILLWKKLNSKQWQNYDPDSHMIEVHFLFSWNMFLNCRDGPQRNPIERRLRIFPKEYIETNGTGFPSSRCTKREKEENVITSGARQDKAIRSHDA